jgi:diaminopimelate epimerase
MAPVSVAWAKGHGTENDFVLLPDPDGSVHGELDPALVRALCDRRRGLGADGVLRVVRSVAYGPAARVAAPAEWFMDYRNGDGSTAEMCGNGVRVFARYLVEEGLADPEQPIAVGTLGGVRVVRPAGDGQWTASMGRATLVDAPVTVTVGSRRWPAVGVHVPNPHAVTFVDDLSDAGPLTSPPEVTPADRFLDGVNVEFVVHQGPASVAMRVHERGAGETRSCGTGACAVAVVAMRADGASPGTPYAVDVPGGRLTVVVRPDGEVEMTGPAVLVARGVLDDEWLAREPGRHVDAP